uniref:Uncharacterized protein n=1 Tax=Arundo donax TaxID=35708 RepID=A0A0A9AHK2_ARUDO
MSSASAGARRRWRRGSGTLCLVMPRAASSPATATKTAAGGLGSSRGSGRGWRRSSSRGVCRVWRFSRRRRPWAR